MKKMKKLLIALDYDPTAQKVAETGFSLGKTMNAEIVLLHVISDYVYYSSNEYSPVIGYTGFMDMGMMKTVDLEALKKASTQYLEKFRQHLGDDNIKIITKEGDFAESILDAAKEENADIIVLGSHSRKWLENILMGSVAKKVLDKTSIPLFIIPTKKQ
jgi:nucleotide-binding universal stress UspA family protein